MAIVGPVSQGRLALVWSPLSHLMGVLAGELSFDIGITQGVRDAAEQAALFAQGRQTTAQVNALRLAVGWAPITDAQNYKVTNAPPGYTWHEFGMAVDFVPLLPVVETPDWNLSHPAWQEIVQKGEALGMRSGISWKDEPHFQFTGRYPVTPDDEVRALFKQGGIPLVWQKALAA